MEESHPMNSFCWFYFLSHFSCLGLNQTLRQLRVIISVAQVPSVFLIIRLQHATFHPDHDELSMKNFPALFPNAARCRILFSFKSKFFKLF
jgi:hypothetical protein